MPGIPKQALLQAWGHNLKGPHRLNGPCPRCGGIDRFYATPCDNDLTYIVNCNQGCSFKDINDTLGTGTFVTAPFTNIATTPKPYIPKPSSYIVDAIKSIWYAAYAPPESDIHCCLLYTSPSPRD